MVDLGTAVEAAKALNTLGGALNTVSKVGKEVKNMVSQTSGQNSHNGHDKALAGKIRIIARGKESIEPDADFSDLYEETPHRNQSASKAPACYQAALEHMAELGRLQGIVNYHARLKESKTLQAAEQAKRVLCEATSHGMLNAFHGLIPEPVQPLETLVRKEIGTMAEMQKQVGMAVHHSQGIVGKLSAYDSELLAQFDTSKTELAKQEKKFTKTQRAILSLSEQLEQTPMDDVGYVPLQITRNDAFRTEKETKNKLEILGQEVVDTYKQSSQVRAKEDVVRMGLHELRLVHSYVTRFLTFVQRTRQADDLLPQLVETATAVTNSYQILAGIVQAGSVATTEAVKKLVDVIGTVDYTMLPAVQKEVNKQRSMLEKADKKTRFYEQAVELLRGKNYQAASASAERQPAAAAPPAASAMN